MARRLWDKGEALHPEILEYTVGNDYLRFFAVPKQPSGAIAYPKWLWLALQTVQIVPLAGHGRYLHRVNDELFR